MNPDVREAIKKSAAIPSMPQVVSRFLEVIQDPDFDYDKVVKVLSADAGTVSEILRLSNSALFGVSRKVTSLKQALTLLGPRRTRSLVLGRYLVEAMSGGGQGAIDTSYFWRRSLASAVVAARLADTACPRLRDEVFIAGLLADIGVGILAQTFPKQYSPISGRYAPQGDFFTLDEEFNVVGTNHAEVAHMVLSEWSLPEDVCEAIAMSHGEFDGVKETSAQQIGMLISGSDLVAKLLSELPDDEHCATTCAEAARVAGVSVGVLEGALKDVEADIEELAVILKIDVIPSRVYRQVAEAIREHLVTVPPQ